MLKTLSDKQQIKYSIIIPCKENPEGLEMSLSGIVSDPLLKNYEIIIANDNASPKISQVVEDYSKKNIPVYEIKIKNSKGAYFARNRCIERSRGKVLIFFDDELEIPVYWFEKLEPCIKRYKYIGGDCKMKLLQSDGFIKKFFHLQAFNQEAAINHYHYGGAGFLIVHKSVFDLIGLFDERIESHGDIEFGHRSFEARFKQYFFNFYTVFHKGKSFINYFKTFLRSQRNYHKMSELYPVKYKSYSFSFYNIINKTKLIVIDLSNYKNHKIYIKGNYNFITYLIAYFTFYSFRFYAKTHAYLFPRKRF